MEEAVSIISAATWRRQLRYSVIQVKFRSAATAYDSIINIIKLFLLLFGLQVSRLGTSDPIEVVSVVGAAHALLHILPTNGERWLG